MEQPAKPDMLADMFRRQRALQEEQAKAGKLDLDAKGNFRTQALAAFVELAEAVQEVNWKPWKFTGQTRKDRFTEEVADLMHFIPNMCLAQGVTAEELYAAYCKKNDVNLERIRDGY